MAACCIPYGVVVQTTLVLQHFIIAKMLPLGVVLSKETLIWDNKVLIKRSRIAAEILTCSA